MAMQISYGTVTAVVPPARELNSTSKTFAGQAAAGSAVCTCPFGMKVDVQYRPQVFVMFFFFRRGLGPKSAVSCN